MGREKREVGSLGEGISRKFLTKKGYRIIGANVRTPFGELDLVARYKNSIVFIEVRTRTTSSFGPPYLSVTRAKQMHIIKNALFYLKRYKLSNSNWRIDVVSVKLTRDHKLENIELIENAVEDIYQGGYG